ncbi:Cullin [Limtongia smithiae]|uniref:Cullin n=1 Tax=Limtongia smithiae TaxID=1125753 RepID=UPI0034D01A34
MMSSGKSRIKMRPPRNRDSSDVSFDDSWNVLSTAMQEMYRKNASKLSYEELYRTAYTLVLKKYAERLYNAFKAFVAQHLCEMVATELKPLASNTAYSLSASGAVNSTMAVPLAAADQRESGIRFLKAVKMQWDDHCLCMRMISDILMYMDRVYCKELQLPLIYDAGLALFRDNVIRNEEFAVGEHIYAIILDQIQLQRAGDIVDTSAIKAAVLMLESLTEDKIDGETVYSRSFEPKFLHSSADFYVAEAEQLMRDCDSSQYLIKTERRLEEEYNHVMSYLSVTSEPKITKIVEETLITRNVVAVIQSESSGLSFMIANDRMEDLRRLYRLCRRVDPDKTDLRNALATRVVTQGGEINRDALEELKKPERTKGVSAQSAATTAAFKWVEAVLALKSKYDTILNDTMGGDIQVQTSLTNAFSSFINQMNRCSEFLSLFIDDNLKKGLKGKTEDEAEAVLDRAITLFRYISDKDMFESYYKSHLAKRLLGGRSLSDDSERMMITKLKMEVGFSFTTKLEGMFKDMRVSSDMMQDYKTHVANTDPERQTEIVVSVLTSTNWPVSLANTEAHTCIFPAGIERIKRSFEKFYVDRHSGRVLTWNPNMGNADLRVAFRKRKHELNVSTYAMVILMLFNEIPDGESLSFDDIKGATSIPEVELVRNLQSLAVVPKTRILLKEPMSKDIKPTDRFTFNLGFESQYIRIKIPTVAYINKTETDTERKETVDKVDALRRYQTDAAIVRIMKARKTLDHNILVAEVTSQLSVRFHPDAALIKKRIDAMLEREYIERSAENRQVYNYLA